MSRRTEAAIVIDAPMDLVWDMTNDVESWPELFTEYAEAEILERDGDTIRFRLALHPNEEGKVWSWVSERRPDRESRTVEAHRIETGPFEFMNIFWDYTPAEDGGVRMRWVQEFHVKDEMPFDDEAMAAHISKNTAEQMPHIKKQVEKAARNQPS